MQSTLLLYLSNVYPAKRVAKAAPLLFGILKLGTQLGGGMRTRRDLDQLDDLIKRLIRERDSVDGRIRNLLALRGQIRREVECSESSTA